MVWAQSMTSSCFLLYDYEFIFSFICLDFYVIIKSDHKVDFLQLCVYLHE